LELAVKLRSADSVVMAVMDYEQAAVAPVVAVAAAVAAATAAVGVAVPQDAERDHSMMQVSVVHIAHLKEHL
jgi:hypothetical protein